MQRLVKRVLEKQGSLPKTEPHSSPVQLRQIAARFFYGNFLAAIAIAGLGSWVTTFSVVLASITYLFALTVFFLGFRRWCNTPKKTLTLIVATAAFLLAVALVEYNWIRKEWTPTYLYLVPTHELIDCERRAFFVNHFGFKGLQNVSIVIKDNKSGAVFENNNFNPGIEPGPQNPDAPRYIWVKPSNPWDEHYTIEVTGTKFHSQQELVLYSAGQDVQFATQITINSNKKSVVSCRDSELPETYSLGRGSESCNTLMAVDPELLDKLNPKAYVFQEPNRDVTIVRHRVLPSSAGLDSQSEDRHLTEFERTVMRSKLSKYHGMKILILYAGGPKTLAYATEFRDLLQSIRWRVYGPHLAPVGDERIVDLQVSASASHWTSPYPVATDLVNSLEGTKHRQLPSFDSAIPRADRIVLWVGPKSPENWVPDDCAPAELMPELGKPHNCDVVRQNIGSCPLRPKDATPLPQPSGVTSGEAYRVRL